MGNQITVPYSGLIPGGIHVGTDVVINGRVPHHAHIFSINLCMGPTIESGTALHFNPRFHDHKVVRNHCQGGAWGVEETGGGMPFHKGHGFELHIKVNPHGYKFTLNQKHFCDFHHRVPKESVQYIQITGDVVINFIQFREVQRGHHHHHHHQPAPSFPVPAVAPAYPAAAPGYPPATVLPTAPGYPTGTAYPPQPAYPQQPAYPPPSYAPAAVAPGGGPIYNPAVPFTSGIPGGLQPGKIIYITGVPLPTVQRFTVNILCGPSIDHDVALHFDVRFRFGSDVNQVVRNAKKQGGWGAEERAITYFPFMPNGSFEMMILTEPNSFKVAVNNQHFVEFVHRVKRLQRATHVSVTGDVQLTQVRFQ